MSVTYENMNGEIRSGGIVVVFGQSVIAHSQGLQPHPHVNSINEDWELKLRLWKINCNELGNNEGIYISKNVLSA